MLRLRFTHSNIICNAYKFIFERGVYTLHVDQREDPLSFFCVVTYNSTAKTIL